MDEDTSTRLDSSFTSDTSTIGSGNAVGNEEGVVQQAKTAVTDTVQTVTETVSNQVSKVTDAVSNQVDKVTNTAADKVEQLADTIAPATFDGDAPKVQRQVVGTTVNILDRTAEYLREGDVEVVLEDLRDAVRRHPLRTLAIGLGLGFLARGRFFPAASKPTSSSVRRSPQGMQPYSPPRSIPVYAAPSTTDYGFDYSNAGARSSDIASGGVLTSSTGTMGSAALGDSLLYGADADMIGSIPTGSSLDMLPPLATDDSFGTSTDTDFGSGTLGSAFDMDSSTGGTSFDAGLGGSSGTDLDLGLGDSGLGSVQDADMIGSEFGMDATVTDDFGSTAPGSTESTFDNTGLDSGQFDQDTNTSNTNSSSGGSFGVSDVLKRWDENTRNQS